MANTKPANTAQRLLQYPLVRLIIGFVFVFSMVIVTQIVVQYIPPLPVLRLVRAALICAAALVTYIWFVIRFEKRPAMELSTASGWWRELLAGLLLGALLFSITIGALALLGYYQVVGTNPASVMLGALAGSAVSGVFEEILFRGLLFRIIEEWVGTWVALGVSALVFGVLHLTNPGATLWAGLSVALEAGVMLAAAYVLTRRLWLAIGIHTAWNFVQGGIFGVAVSGNEIDGLLRARLVGPEMLTGGAFGAEASLIALAVCTLAGIGLLWLAYRRGHVHARPVSAPGAAGAG